MFVRRLVAVLLVAASLTVAGVLPAQALDSRGHTHTILWWP